MNEPAALIVATAVVMLLWVSFYVSNILIPRTRARARQALRDQYLAVVASSAPRAPALGVALDGPLDGHVFQVDPRQAGVHFHTAAGSYVASYALAFRTDRHGRRIFQHVTP